MYMIKVTFKFRIAILSLLPILRNSDPEAEITLYYMNWFMIDFFLPLLRLF